MKEKMLDPQKIKKDFPILSREINGHPLVYLDNAATSQKPKQVIDAVSNYYLNNNANVHRGLHTLSEEASDMYENARIKVAGFIGAKPREVAFTKGTTESINRVVVEWGKKKFKKGDVVLITEAEHHSNLVPWQILTKMTNAVLDVVELDEEGEITAEAIKEKIEKHGEKLKLVSVLHASNVLGTILPVKKICTWAHEVGAVVSVDGAQAAPHFPVNVESLGCDFYSFSGHKMLAPMGIGVLWVTGSILDDLEPYEYGGGMIDQVSLKESTWADPPVKFEAGTPNVSGAIGLASAVDYLNEIGMANIQKHEIELNKYSLEKLGEFDDIKILGTKDPTQRTGLVSFVLGNIHPHDVAAVLNAEGIAVRSGHHCAMPLHKKLGIAATTRASYYLYNSKEDLDKLVSSLKKAVKILG